MKKLIAGALALSLSLAAPLPTEAQSNTTQEVLMTAGDILLLRPFSFAATVIGFAVFVVGYPIIAFTDNGDAWEDLVAKPGRATFTRCIGCDLIEEPASEDHDEAS